VTLRAGQQGCQKGLVLEDHYVDPERPALA
ncbi:uncharacterized protein METZ01_LOCUS275144, partial [marine metagenome]